MSVLSQTNHESFTIYFEDYDREHLNGIMSRMYFTLSTPSNLPQKQHSLKGELKM